MGNEQKTKSNSFLLQGMILASAGIITRLIGIAYRIPVNNILGDEGQGLYGCAFSIYNIALLLTSYSLPLAVSKLVSARVAKGEHKNANRIFKGALFFALIVGALVGLLVYVFSDFISGTLMSMKLSAYALRVLAPCLFVVAIMGVVRGYFQGLGTMVPTAISQIIEQIVNAIVSIVGASYLLEMGKKVAQLQNEPDIPYAYGAAGGTLGTLSGAVFGLIFLLILMKVYQPKAQQKMLQDSDSNKENYGTVFALLFATIAPVILSTAIYNINDTIDQSLFSTIIQKQGKTEKTARQLLGMFTGKYNTLIHIPLAFSNALGASLIPSLTGAVTKGDKKEIHTKIHLVIRVVLLIAIPSCIAFMVIPNEILSLLYIGNIEIPAKMLRIGAITVVFYCLSTVTNSILQGLNKMTTPVKHGAISLGIHLIAVITMLGVFKWSIYSLVVGNIVFSLCMCILNARAMKKTCGYRQEYKKSYMIPSLAAIIMGIALFAINYLGKIIGIPSKIATIFGILFAIVVYVVSLLKLGGLSPEEIKALPKGSVLLRILQKLRLIKTEVQK